MVKEDCKYIRRKEIISGGETGNIADSYGIEISLSCSHPENKGNATLICENCLHYQKSKENK